MRADMFKVIVERPPRASQRRSAEAAARRPHQGVQQPRPRTKSLNENLAPLARFLRRNVGRPWSDVYSEICAGLNVRSAVQKHVRDHLKDLVRLHAQDLQRGKRDILYVCPRTGILRVLIALPHKLRAERQSEITWVRPARRRSSTAIGGGW
jgi:hypothetical protein